MGFGPGIDVAATFDNEGAFGWDSQWLNNDVTRGVQTMGNGAETNYGWKIVPVSGNNNIKIFFSRDYAINPSLRPALTIKYH